MRSIPRSTRPPLARVLVSALGVGCFTLAALTAAGTVDWGRVLLVVDGRENTFDLQASGSDEPQWLPSESSWKQGNPSPAVVILRDSTVGPGAPITLRVAVRNSSPRLGAIISLHVLKPGQPSQLFDLLRFTIEEGGHVYADHVDAAAANAVPLLGLTAAGGERVLELTVSLAPAGGRPIAGMTTPVTVSFTGASG